MHRIDTEGSVSGRFADGNPQTGQASTIVDDEWLNAVQEALIDPILFAGIALVKGDNTQLRQAIIALAAGAAGSGDGAVPTTRLVSGGGLVTGGGALAANLTLSVAKATAAEVLAGTRDDVAITPLAQATARPRSLTSNGYITLDGGFMIQWLRASIGANQQVILTLPTSFTTECYGAFVNGGRSTTNAQENTFVSGDGLSNISVYNAQDVTISVNILAIGK